MTVRFDIRFEKELLKFKDDLVKGGQEVVRTVATETFMKLTEKPPEGTPIDTQWAVSNWMISADSPTTTPVGDKSIAGVAAAKAVQYAHLSAILSVDMKTVDIIHVYNNVPYIIYLNDDGTSKQTKPFFIERAVQHANVVATKEVAKL